MASTDNPPPKKLEFQETELHDIVNDLQQSLKINKLIIQDVLASKTQSTSVQSSIDTQHQYFISSKAYNILMAQNTRLSSAIQRLNNDLSNSQINIEREALKSIQTKKRKKQTANSIKQKILNIRQQLKLSENKIQQLQVYCDQLESQIQDLNQSEQIDPLVLVDEGKKLVRKVKKQLKKAVLQRDQAVFRCRELEKEVKQYQSMVKTPGVSVGQTVDRILASSHHFETNFENYWKEQAQSEEEAEAIEGSPEPRSPRAELRKLELAHSVKREEIKSLQRLTDILDRNHSLLCSAVNKKKLVR